MSSTVPTEATEAMFSIDSIKELMDSFDPASLLPELDTIFGKVELVSRVAVLIGPVVLLVMGLAYLIFSPKQANYYFGYRCYFGMGSSLAWRFAQKLAGAVWAALGLGLTVTMVLICGSFRQMEMMDMVGKAVTCLIWEAALIALSCLAVNFVVMVRYDRNGDLRKHA